MDQSSIIEILNRHIFNEDKATLIQTIAEYPDRFVGVFRSTTPRLKLFQNLLQSREIRFGDALEEIITLMLADMGFSNLDKRLLTTEDELACDQYFCSPDRSKFYLVEHKVRDDHDSTKKHGQMDNFRKKLVYLKSIHGESLVGIMYFIDPSLRKNTKFYKTEIDALRDELNIPLYLFYNGEFFSHLQGHTDTWNILLSSLQNWRKNVPEQITLDFDANSEQTFTQLKSVPLGVWHKLIVNDDLWNSGIVTTIFPNGATLQKLESWFRSQGANRLRIARQSLSLYQLAELLRLRLERYYGKSNQID